MNFPSELDVFSCPLKGVNQIEASAGTGKTWNLCALYLRLLLEQALDVNQILVVTFSKAATTELRQRIRNCIAQLLHALAVGDASDPLVTQMLKKLSTSYIEQTQVNGKLFAYEEAQRRLERAWHHFDQAAIYTIHAFCQQVLMDASFAALRPFEVELAAQEQDDALRFDTAVEFWQTLVEPAVEPEPGFAAWLAQRSAGPAVLAQQLAQRLKKPLAQLIFGTAQQVPNERVPNDLDYRRVADALTHLFAKARKLWSRDREIIAQIIKRSLNQLNSASYKPTTITRAFNAWTNYFDSADAYAYATLGDKANLLTASVLSKRIKKKGALPKHRFFQLADALIAQTVALDKAYSARWLSFVQMWLDWAPDRLRAKKRAQRIVTFDDLLTNLQQALVDQPQLAQALKQRYPVALIDEFQDTDPIQFDIFKRIFIPQGPLFLIGDPKQAIYSFRAADLHTYLTARMHAAACYTLTTNQRSTALFITACNRMFSANPAAFMLRGLNYQAVQANIPTSASKHAQHRPSSRRERAPGALHIWLLPHGEHVLSKHDAMHAAAHACAAEIVRLLYADQEKQPLMPSDIAILVQTHKQGSLVKHVLAEWGLASIETTQISIFSTQEAEYLERVLRAIDTPHNAGCLRGALTVDWLGLDAQSLFLFDNRRMEEVPADATSLMSWTERFAHYRTLWHKHGFAVMWRTFMRELRIAQRIATSPNGERQLTNLMHLVELVSARAANQSGIASTLHWLRAQRKVQRCDDETQLRLESDQNLVQIMTVHKSKGLEFPFVFCPFLSDDAQRTAISNPLANVCEYHTQDGCALLHYGDGTTELTNAKQAVRQEQAAERVRLIYVALTRAINHCFIVAGLYTSGPSASTKSAKQSVLNWLVTNVPAGGNFSTWLANLPQDDEIIASWYALANEAIVVAPLPRTLPDDSPRPVSTSGPSLHMSPTDTLQARSAQRALHESWQITSFSSLMKKAEDEQVQAVLDDEGGEEDECAIAIGERIASITSTASIASNDILHFPRGPIAGHCLHRLFELTDFTAPSTWSVTIERALREHPLHAPASLTQQIPAMMTRLLHDVTSTELTPLAPGLTLALIDPAHRLAELEFTFPATFELTALRQLLQSYGYPVPEVLMNTDALTGYMKGFIDLVFEYDKRFWIIDWKSNHLGYTAADYQYAALHQAMTQHGYHLQALIYTIALHRYLRLRLPNYHYALHFGGYLYLFVRGVRPEWQMEGEATGVYADMPDTSLIDALDRLMGNHQKQ